MEMWSDNLSTYDSDIEAGAFQELGVNFDDNFQGFYVPRYVIEGDPARGIEASAPDLLTVADLADYAGVFPDPESPGKGRIYGGIPGWDITEIMRKKVDYYGLDEMYNYVVPGSDAAMNATLISAWAKGAPIVAYYWEPTWLLGMYDFVLLEDAPYEEAAYQEGKTACPPVRVTICVSNEFSGIQPGLLRVFEELPHVLRPDQRSSGPYSGNRGRLQRDREMVSSEPPRAGRRLADRRAGRKAESRMVRGVNIHECFPARKKP